MHSHMGSGPRHTRSLTSCLSILPAFVEAGSMVCSVVLYVGTPVLDMACDASTSPVSWVHVFSALCLFVEWYSTSDVALHVVSVRFSVNFCAYTHVFCTPYFCAHVLYLDLYCLCFSSQFPSLFLAAPVFLDDCLCTSYPSMLLAYRAPVCSSSYSSRALTLASSAPSEALLGCRFLLFLPRRCLVLPPLLTHVPMYGRLCFSLPFLRALQNPRFSFREFLRDFSTWTSGFLLPTLVFSQVTNHLCRVHPGSLSFAHMMFGNSSSVSTGHATLFFSIFSLPDSWHLHTLFLAVTWLPASPSSLPLLQLGRSLQR